MAWNMTPVAVSASAVKYPLAEIPPDVKDAVDEAFDYSTANPAARLVVTFEDEATAELNKAYIRSYAEARPAGRLTASIWSGFAQLAEDGSVSKFSQTETADAKVHALSLRFTKYEKRSRAAAATDAAGNGQAAANPSAEA